MSWEHDQEETLRRKKNPGLHNILIVNLIRAINTNTNENKMLSFGSFWVKANIAVSHELFCSLAGFSHTPNVHIASSFQDLDSHVDQILVL